MKYLITGNAGSGKSTVISELKKQGYVAYDTDSTPDVTMFIPNTSPGLAYRSVWDKTVLQSLLSSSDTVFIGGSVTNQQEFYPLFDKIFALTLDKHTLKERLTTRTSNDTGKDPEDLQFLLDIHDRVQSNLVAANAVTIDASQALNKVVEEIVKNL
jgi:dephospho-CoA kinase